MNYVTRSTITENSRTKSNTTKRAASNESTNDWSPRARNFDICFKTLDPNLKRFLARHKKLQLLQVAEHAGLEAAVVNVVQPDDEVLVIVTGAFGERFHENL